MLTGLSMNSGMAKKPIKIVLDTNVVISALIFGGKPQKVFMLVIEKRVVGISSNMLLAELLEILVKKFNFEEFFLRETEKRIRKTFTIVRPNKILKVLDDEPDNRVLEAAVYGGCDYIVTGDKELLELGSFDKVSIINIGAFLDIFEKN